jgi:hypothetical protein
MGSGITFVKVIDKAKSAGLDARVEIGNHFADVGKMIALQKKA